MKMISKMGDHILFERWETPLEHSSWNFWLAYQLLTPSNLHFFFQQNLKSPVNEFCVLTIHCFDPFRITEEGVGWTYIGAMMTPKDSDHSELNNFASFKIWNTDFAINAYKGEFLSKEEFEKEEKIQYLIASTNHWIEFVCFGDPKWEVHRGGEIGDLVDKYLRADILKNRLDDET